MTLIELGRLMANHPGLAVRIDADGPWLHFRFEHAKDGKTHVEGAAVNLDDATISAVDLVRESVGRAMYVAIHRADPNPEVEAYEAGFRRRQRDAELSGPEDIR